MSDKTEPLFKPFNDILYKNCFYNQLFTVFNFMQIDYTSLIANDIHYYDGFETNFTLESKAISNENTVFDEIGVKLDGYSYSEKIIYNLIKCCESGRGAVVFIDCFYYPVRYDNYKTLHNEHCVAVIRTDIINQVFYIVDHNYQNSLRYVEQSISFVDLNNCCKGYYEHISRGPSYYEVYKTEMLNNRTDSIDIFHSNYKTNYDLIYNGYTKLLLFNDFLSVKCIK